MRERVRARRGRDPRPPPPPPVPAPQTPPPPLPPPAKAAPGCLRSTLFAPSPSRHAGRQQPGHLVRHLSAAPPRGVERLDADRPHLPVLPVHRGRRHDRAGGTPWPVPSPPAGLPSSPRGPASPIRPPRWPSGAGSGPHASSRPARARSKACPGPGRHSGKPFDRRRIPDCRVDPDKALRHNEMAGHWTNRCGPGPATASIGLTSRPAESIFSPPTVRGQWCSPRTPGCPAGGHRLLDTMRVTGVTLLARPARNARRAVTAS